MKLGVRVVYCNSSMRPVCEKHYDLKTYLDYMRNDLLRLISDVEDTLYQASGTKEDWPDSVWLGFSKIKHKILDKAGDIGRLTDNIYEVKEEEYGQNRMGQTREHSGCDPAHSSCGCEEHEGLSPAVHN